MIQGFANSYKLLDINSATLENGIDIWSPAIYTPRKFGHAQTALVENEFNKCCVAIVLSFYNKKSVEVITC